MSDSDDSNITSNSLYITLDYSLKIQNITCYYRRATERLFDDTGSANALAPEALAGSLRLNDARDLVLQHRDQGQEAMLSYPWSRVESAQKEFREVTDRFEVKLEQVKALDSRWDEVDADEIQGSATYDELISIMTRLWFGRSTIPTIPSVTLPELPSRSSLGSGVTPWEKFQYAKLESPKSTTRLVRMESISTHPEPLMRVTTRTISLQDKVPYATLSYTWGNPFGLFCSEKDRDAVPRTDIPIICDGKRLEIGENLYRFLWRWREKLATRDDTARRFHLSDRTVEYLRPPVEIWIDAICINQEDIEERNQQVSIMGDIYTKSAATWVWLGEHDQFSQVALTILRRMSTLYSHSDGVDLGSLDDLDRDEVLASLSLPDSNSWGWFAVFAFFQRQWFRRSWVVQEATLSSRLLFQCGSAVMSGVFIFSALGGLRQFESVTEGVQLGEAELKSNLASRPSWKQMGLERPINEPSDSKYYICRDGIAPGFAGYLPQVIRIKALDPKILAKDRNSLKPISSENKDKFVELLNLWKTSQNTLCGDLRDKVYAFAALVNSDIYRTPNTVKDRRALQPDYKKSVSEVYCEAAWFTLLTHASLDVLSMAGHTSLNSSHALPSWVPDLSSTSRIHSANKYLFSLNHHLKLNPGLGWLASGGVQWEIPPPAERHGQHLDVRVSVVGRIKETEHGELENTSEHHLDARFRNFLGFSSLLPSTYLSHQDGQTRLEVIWRTIIADAIDGVSPASPKHAASFEKACKEAIEPVLEGNAAGNVDDKDLSRTTPAVRDTENLQDLSASLSQMDIGDDEYRKYWERSYETMRTRRLFIADTGHVGCGESGLSIGDLIVVVAGCSIPLLLRQSSSGRYVLIGEAYVHGIMFGEHAMKPGVEWESITLE